MKNCWQFLVAASPLSLAIIRDISSEEIGECQQKLVVLVVDTIKPSEWKNGLALIKDSLQQQIGGENRSGQTSFHTFFQYIFLNIRGSLNGASSNFLFTPLFFNQGGWPCLVFPTKFITRPQKRYIQSPIDFIHILSELTCKLMMATVPRLAQFPYKWQEFLFKKT